MKIVKPHAEIVSTDTIPRIKMMEMVGRLCYRSEDKINPESAEDFIVGVLRKGHWSVTEFAVFTVRVRTNGINIENFLLLDNKYLIIDREKPGMLLITGTARALREAIQNNPDNNVLGFILHALKPRYAVFFNDINTNVDYVELVELLSNDNIAHLSTDLFKRHKFVMVHYVVNRAVSHELVRHRPVSWMQESQRYCRYDDDKFGSEVTFIDPRGAFKFFNGDSLFGWDTWKKTMVFCELQYLNSLEQKASPQAARTMLPNSCRTELYQMCNLAEYEIFFGLRDAPGKAEPSMVEVAAPLHQEFKDRFPDVFDSPLGI